MLNGTKNEVIRVIQDVFLVVPIKVKTLTSIKIIDKHT